MDANQEWWIKERLKKTVEKLKKHGFEAIYVATKEEAVKEIWKYVTPHVKVGTAGSITIREIGILDYLTTRGHTVYDHWKPGLSKQETLEIRKSQIISDLFLGSMNAVTMNGEVVNIDSVGNRVNATVFGPGKVILVAGYNKIVEDVQEAINRTRNVVAPINARRLNIDVPCAKIGKCVNCDSPNRICRVIVIHERKPMLTDILIILVGEALGY